MKDREDQKGFSLVELLIVLAIMAVLGVVAVSVVGAVSGFRLNRCAKRIDSAIQESKVNALSGGEGWLTISRAENGDYYLQCSDGTTEHLTDSRIVISYCIEGEETEYLITPEKPMTLSFDAATGAFSSMDEDDEVYCKKVILRMGEWREVRIALVKETGAHMIE